MTTSRLLLVLGALSGAVAVAVGAFGAHALSEAVTVERLNTWRTGASYHLAHALAIVLAAVVLKHSGSQLAGVAGWCFVGGTALFSGSLYALVLLDLPVLGAVTPFGGAAFIAGWLCLAAAAWKSGEGASE